MYNVGDLVVTEGDRCSELGVITAIQGDLKRYTVYWFVSKGYNTVSEKHLKFYKAEYNYSCVGCR